MTENPERLWAYAHQGGETIRAEASADLAEQDRGEYVCDPAPVAEYIRADVVAREREAAVRVAEDKHKNRDVEVMRVALASLRAIRATLASRADVLRVAGEDDRAAGIDEAIKTLDETVFA